MKRPFFAVLALALICSAGCPSGQLISDDYVKADRATFMAVSGEYLTYVFNNGALDDEERKRRQRTILSWRLRLEQMERHMAAAAVESAAGVSSSR